MTLFWTYNRDVIEPAICHDLAILLTLCGAFETVVVLVASNFESSLQKAMLGKRETFLTEPFCGVLDDCTKLSGEGDFGRYRPRRDARE